MKLVYRSIFLCVVVSVCWVKATNIRFEIISSGVEVAQSFHGHDQEQAPDRADPAKRRRGVSRSTTRRHLRVVADGLGAGAGAGAGFDENSTALLLPSGTKITFDSLFINHIARINGTGFDRFCRKYNGGCAVSGITEGEFLSELRAICNGRDGYSVPHPSVFSVSSGSYSAQGSLAAGAQGAADCLVTPPRRVEDDSDSYSEFRKLVSEIKTSAAMLLKEAQQGGKEALFQRRDAAAKIMSKIKLLCRDSWSELSFEWIHYGKEECPVGSFLEKLLSLCMFKKKDSAEVVKLMPMMEDVLFCFDWLKRIANRTIIFSCRKAWQGVVSLTKDGSPLARQAAACLFQHGIESYVFLKDSDVTGLACSLLGDHPVEKVHRKGICSEAHNPIVSFLRLSGCEKGRFLRELLRVSRSSVSSTIKFPDSEIRLSVGDLCHFIAEQWGDSEASAPEKADDLQEWLFKLGGDARSCFSKIILSALKENPLHLGAASLFFSIVEHGKCGLFQAYCRADQGSPENAFSPILDLVRDKVRELARSYDFSKALHRHTFNAEKKIGHSFPYKLMYGRRGLGMPGQRVMKPFEDMTLFALRYFLQFSIKVLNGEDLFLEYHNSFNFSILRHNHLKTFLDDAKKCAKENKFFEAQNLIEIVLGSLLEKEKTLLNRVLVTNRGRRHIVIHGEGSMLDELLDVLLLLPKGSLFARRSLFHLMKKVFTKRGLIFYHKKMQLLVEQTYNCVIKFESDGFVRHQAPSSGKVQYGAELASFCVMVNKMLCDPL